MASLGLRAWTTSGQDFLDYGVQSLQIVQGSAGLAVYSGTGSTGGLVGYSLSAGGSLTLQDTRFYSGSAPVGGWMSLVDGALVVGGSGPVGLIAYDMAGSGGIGSGRMIGSLSGDIGRVQALAQLDNGMLYLSDGGGGIFQYHSDGAGGFVLRNVSGSAAADATSGVVQDVIALKSLEVGGVTYVLAADCSARGVLSYRADSGDGSLSLQGSMSADKGLGVMAPVDMEVAHVLGESFVLLASAGSSGGAISVMRVDPGGALVPTDHVLDTLATRFGQVQSLEVVAAGGHVYVIAGGGDDGLSLFVLAPGGRLVHLQTMVDSAAAGLDNVSAIAAARLGDRLEVMVASQSEAGLTHFNMSLGNNGTVAAAAGGGARLSGTERDDILTGGAGNDRLIGGAGDDIVIGGRGRDTLDGGAGADIYVLEGGGDPVRILGFEPGRDRLDLSGYAMFYGAAQLDIETTSWGAWLRFGNETVEIHRQGGGGLGAAEIAAALHVTPDRPPLGLARETTGSAGADILTGHWGTDYIEGRAGNDRIAGQAGDDKLFGGAGNDRIVGEEGHDSVYGGAGWDTLFGGPGDDLVVGGDGRDIAFLGAGNDRFEDNAQTGANAHDRVFGEAGNDTILGGGGNDTLAGGPGRDSLSGGVGDDVLFGGAGDDWLLGGAGNDTLCGMFGNDWILGAEGDDMIYGGAGFDTLLGGIGNDTVFGGDGRDEVHLGDGHDLFLDNGQGGERGRDTVYAGAGNDTIQGGNGADLFVGGDGEDSIHGRLGADLIFGGAGADTLTGGAGADTLTGGAGDDDFVFAAGHGGPDRITDFTQGEDLVVFEIPGLVFGGLHLSDSAAGAVVDYTSGRIILEGIDAADLGADDFLFQ